MCVVCVVSCGVHIKQTFTTSWVHSLTPPSIPPFPRPPHYFFPSFFFRSRRYNPTQCTDWGAPATGFSYPTLVDPDHCYNGFKDADENGSDCGGGCKKACVRQTSGGAAWVSDKVSEKKWEKRGETRGETRGEKRGENREEYGIRVFLDVLCVCVVCECHQPNCL